jgi:hypothetical protein
VHHFAKHYFTEHHFDEHHFAEHHNCALHHFAERNFDEHHFAQHHFAERHFTQHHFDEHHFTQHHFDEHHFGERHFDEHHFAKHHFIEHHFDEHHFDERHFDEHHFDEHHFGERHFDEHYLAEHPFAEHHFDEHHFDKHHFGDCSNVECHIFIVTMSVIILIVMAPPKTHLSDSNLLLHLDCCDFLAFRRLKLSICGCPTIFSTLCFLSIVINGSVGGLSQTLDFGIMRQIFYHCASASNCPLATAENIAQKRVLLVSLQIKSCFQAIFLQGPVL